MSATNNMLVIQGTAGNSFGYLLLAFALICLFYTIIAIKVQESRIRKLKQAATLIREGHERRISHRETAGSDQL
jgi:hypothetical protein